jgi:uncharacterized protein YgbK (DUF1537 family)
MAITAAADDDRAQDDDRRVVVFDDDPTGTQTVSDVDVLLRPTRGRLGAFFRSGARAIYGLTDTRALGRAAALDHLGKIRQEVDRAARRAGQQWVPVLRGDSTLRGHVFAESDLFATTTSVLLFVPAFPEGGRITADGRQFVMIGGREVNSADTEFAADPTFGYRARDLVSWVAEVGGPRPTTVIPLSALRTVGPTAVSTVLQQARPGTVVIPEATTGDDLRVIATGLRLAESGGREVVLRCASSFAAIRAGLVSRAIRTIDVAAPQRVLIACGSVTAASTTQLAALAARDIGIVETDPTTTPRRFAKDVRARLEEDGVAVLATPRARTDDRSLASGAAVMDRLADVVRLVRSDVDAVIAKGGITSGRMAISLGADVARVNGQVAPGVAVWTLRLAADRPMPYVVVPGNVGDEHTLVDALAVLRPDQES